MQDESSVRRRRLIGEIQVEALTLPESRSGLALSRTSAQPRLR